MSFTLPCRLSLQAGCSARDVIAHAKTKRKIQPSGGGGFGPAPVQPAAPSEAAPASSGALAADGQPQAAAPSSGVSRVGGSGGGRLPEVGREQVLGACVQTSAVLAALGVGLHQVAPLIAPAAHDGNTEALQALLQWPTRLTPGQAGVGLAAGAGVTAARLALQAVWPSFREASDRSNLQVLSPLNGPAEVAVVAVLPALAEELMFRGALLPAVYPDWRGVAVAGAVFGSLHLNGGRNAAFAAWASGVGCVYGAAFLATGNLWVPALAHAVANVAAAALWLQDQPGKR